MAEGGVEQRRNKGTKFLDRINKINRRGKLKWERGKIQPSYKVKLLHGYKGRKSGEAKDLALDLGALRE